VSLPIEVGKPVVVALADGMGGYPAGDEAARIAADQLTRLALSSADDLDAVFQQADAAIHAAAITDERRGMGCTASAILIQATGEAVIANVGDVRVYRLADGYLGQLTVDDRPASAPGAAPTGAVTRWLGGVRRTVVRVHRHEHVLESGDRLILCTDGLHDVLSLKTMQDCGHRDANRMAEGLVAAAGDEGDNVTVVILDAHGPDLSTSPADTDERDPIALPAAVASALNDILPSPLDSGRPVRSRRSGWSRFRFPRRSPIEPDGEATRP